MNEFKVTKDLLNILKITCKGGSNHWRQQQYNLNFPK